jgi:hypothetical protein
LDFSTFDFDDLFRMRNEFTHKQHQTEIVNFNEYSNRRQKELLKRHALNQKQFPKNIKVKQLDSPFVENLSFRSNKLKSNVNIKKHIILNHVNIKH